MFITGMCTVLLSNVHTLFITLDSIRRGLESNDMIEVEAAIFAVNCFCQYSKYVLYYTIIPAILLLDFTSFLTCVFYICFHLFCRNFSAAMCEKIADMVQGRDALIIMTYDTL